MVSIESFRQIALSLPGVIEQPHFEKTSFRINKKIFATLDTANNRVVVKLSEIDQSTLSSYDNAIIYPVKGGWGKQGWTTLELKKIKKSMVKDALAISYQIVSSPKTKNPKTSKRKKS